MKSPSTILIVEDNERLNNFIASQLAKNGYETVQTFNGSQAFEELKENCFDLVVLDIMLGDTNGLDILKSIRSQDKTLPVMIISSIADDETKINGFRIGCDDYLTKPFYTNDMMMRIKRMLERRELEGMMHSTVVSQSVNCGPFEADTAALTIKKNGVIIPVRKKYFDMMLYFMRHPNIVIPFKTLFDHVWDKEVTDISSVESNLYVNIRNLRMLIEDDPANPKFIVSVRHVGYTFRV